MGMTVGPRGSIRSEPNMAPLIDVVLVLLIIMMVVMPMLQKAHRVDLPQEGSGPAPPPPGPLVLKVDGGGEVTLLGRPVATGDLEEALAAELARRESRIVFVDADASLGYASVVALLDAASHAGAERVGIVPSH